MFNTLYDEAIVRQRIRRVAPFQVAKVMGVVYTIAGLLFVPIFYFASMATDAAGFGIAFVIALPVLYGIAGFIFSAAAAALYNIVAGWIGGIEMDLEPANPDT